MPSLNYFSQYPNVIYRRPSYSQTPLTSANGTTLDYDVTLTDILIKYRISDQVASNSALFYPYQWKDADRPDLLALQYYGASSKFWIVMYSAKAADVDFDFPLEANIFNNFLEQKYRSVVMVANGYDPTSPSSITTYLAIPDYQRFVLTVAYLQSQVREYTVFFSDEPTVIFNVTLDQYNYYNGSGYTSEVLAAASLGVTLPTATVGIITLFDYEQTTNENKRNISLLDNDFTQQITTEFNNTLQTLRSQSQQIGDI